MKNKDQILLESLYSKIFLKEEREEKLENGSIIRYNDKGVKIYHKYPSGAEYRYDDNGELIYSKGLNGAEYFTEPCKLTIKYPDGTEEIKEWDDRFFDREDGDDEDDDRFLIYHKDQMGNENFWRYDEKGRLIFQKNSAGSIEEWKYDNRDMLIYHKLPDGRDEIHTYDENGILVYYKGLDGTESSTLPGSKSKEYTIVRTTTAGLEMHSKYHNNSLKYSWKRIRMKD
jgi:YD repeat-containing protein